MTEHPVLQENQISGYFRANVGILIINSEGLVLVAERIERPGAWQLPQGGINQGEEEDQAVLREIKEEIGFGESEINNLLQPIGNPSNWLAYQLPKSNWSKKNGRGQVQKYFAYRYIGKDEQLDEKFSRSQEFSAWKWISISDLIKDAWHIRRPVYISVGQTFSKYLT